MTLDEIAQGIQKNFREWGTEHIQDLDAVANRMEFKQCIVRLIQESIQHPLSRIGNPAKATENAIKFAATSNFRLGLLAGLLLWKPSEDGQPPIVGMDLAPGPDRTTVSERCERCETVGQICEACGLSRFNCTCVLGEYAPVKCPECAGTGYLTNN